ncbi:MAG: M14 family zinc carboxypeptidase [Phycisphaerales bacterium]
MLTGKVADASGQYLCQKGRPPCPPEDDGSPALLIALAGAALTVTPLPAASAQDRANVSTRTIGLSGESRNIDLLTLSSSPDDADSRPALLVVAGIDATHVTGTRVARHLAERLVSEHADLLNDYTVYIVPLVNPDAASRSTAPDRLL